jgi:hypothetical protein
MGNDRSLEGNGGPSCGVPPIIYKAQRGLALRHRNGAKRRAGAKQTESSDPMSEADGPSTGNVIVCCVALCPLHRR